LKIGIDVDGVVANFNKGYIKLLNSLHNRTADVEYAPQTWNYESELGFSTQEVSEAWQYISKSARFWMELEPTPDAEEFLASLPNTHQYIFITSRPGVNAAEQTAFWLSHHGMPGRFGVEVSSEKGDKCLEHSVDLYLDDKGENILDVLAKSPKTTPYLLACPYNQHVQLMLVDHPKAHTVASVMSFLEVVKG
jgi:uncharacterized HAD superfamily protein